MIEAMVHTADSQIRDGETGFVVDDEAGAIAAVAAIPAIDRAACRADVAARFSVDTMADRYVALYHALLSARPNARSRPPRRDAGRGSDSR